MTLKTVTISSSRIFVVCRVLCKLPDENFTLRITGNMAELGNWNPAQSSVSVVFPKGQDSWFEFMFDVPHRSLPLE
jgi:hypothetical protein